jgi:hypothetical protein
LGKKEEYLKKTLCIFAVLLLVSVFVSAQEFGGIKGKVVDESGMPLPGVSVTLTGSKIPPMSQVTTEGGNFRFLSLPVARDYTLKLELSGFKTITRTELDVSFGRDVELNITMEQATLEEEVTVVGQTPVIDTKKTQVGVNVTQEMIMSLPTARNPWVIMSLVPGMLISKEDVGGNEAGQQSDYTGHGSIANDQTWNIDGANITDNSALGAAPAYLNLASYEELQINYGNNDVKSQTGGVQLNFVSRRGGNNFSGTFYLDAEDQNWQSYNGTPELEALYPTYNPGISRVYMYGANFGGPIVRDKAWFYGSWGIQDINARNIDATTDSTWLVSGYGKLNFQITNSTRAELFLEYDNKLKHGRNDWFEIGSCAPDLRWDQDGPGYIYKGEVEQMFGNLYLNAKALYIDMAFYLHPYEQTLGMPLTISYYPTYFVSGALDDYGTTRSNVDLSVSGNYFAEEVLGGDHEIKFGVDYLVSTVTSYDYYQGNIYLYYYGPDDSGFFPTDEYWEGEVRRDVNINYWMRRYAAFVQDTMTFGRLSINLGLRYDVETSRVKDQSVPASPFLSDLLPALSISSLDPEKSWKTFSPRLSLIYDITGDGKNVFKINLARYGSQEGFGMANFLNPIGWSGIGVYWQDLNGDGLVTNDELFGEDENGLTVPTPETILWAWGTNVDNPTDTNPSNRIDPDYNSPLLDELSVSFEREVMADFSARFEFFYKRAHNGIWDRAMLLDGTLETPANFFNSGIEPYTGEIIWGRYQGFYYDYRTNYPNYHTNYIAGQLVLIKRLSRRWMLDASFTYSDWKRYYEGDYSDPQNIWYYDGGANSWMNSRWQLKISGLYQFPLGIDASWVFRAREGYVLDNFVTAYRPGYEQQDFYAVFDAEGDAIPGVRGGNRLPAFYELDFRLEKIFQVGERSRVVFAVDAFNAFNSHIQLNRDELVTSDRWGEVNKILNPRVFRFGIRFDF